MSRWQQFITWLAGTAPEQTSPMREAVNFGIGETVDPDEYEWRQLSGDAGRDLTPMTQRRMQDIAVYLWEQNVLANRLIELPIAYILAEGVKLKAEDAQVQAVLDKFWRDPINNMNIKLLKKVRELALFGEQCWPAFVNEYDGSVRLGYLDPALIETVVIDPDNGEQPIGVVTCKNKKGIARRFKIIVNGEDEALFTARTQAIRETFADGECFYFSINDLSTSRRGRSDLLAPGDWLDGYDQFLFGELDRIQFLRAFMWDVTLVGATEDEVKRRARHITAPKPGSTRVHNDQEIWKAESPSIGAQDTDDSARLFRNHCLGGATIPEHWFGGAGDVNRATGEDMSGATFKVMSMRQAYVGYMLITVAHYVIRHAKSGLREALKRQVADGEIDLCVQWPEMVAKDTTKYAAALQQVVTAVGLAIDKALLSKETGINLIQSVAGRLGVEFDAESELENLKQEAPVPGETEPAANSRSLSGAEGVQAPSAPETSGYREAVSLRQRTEAKPADPVPDLLDRLGAEAEPAIDSLLASIKAMLDEADDMPDAMQKLAGLFPELNAAQLADVLSQAILASYANGSADAAAGN